MNACSPNKQWYHYDLLLQFETRRFASRWCLSSVTITFATLKTIFPNKPWNYQAKREFSLRFEIHCTYQRYWMTAGRRNGSACAARQISSLRDREFWKWALRDRWTSHRCDSPHVAGSERVGRARGEKTELTSIILEVEDCCIASTCSSFLEREDAEWQIHKTESMEHTPFAASVVLFDHLIRYVPTLSPPPSFSFSFSLSRACEPRLANVERERRPLLIITYGLRGFGTRVELMC